MNFIRRFKNYKQFRIKKNNTIFRYVNQFLYFVRYYYTKC